MKTSTIALVAILAAAAALDAAASIGGSAQDRALRDVTGSVRETGTATSDEGIDWVEAVLAIDGEADLRVRIAPAETIEGSGFSLRRGDVVRVRLFTDRDPPEVQRIRNETTGRVLRLQCLHGEPLWHRGSGSGPGGAGPRHRGGR